MGKACLIYHYYYAVQSVIYIAVGIISLAILGGSAADCKKTCPLVDATQSPCAAVGGVCLGGASPGCKKMDSLYQHSDVAALRTNFADKCFVCVDNNVMYPKYKSTGSLKWVPAPPCSSIGENYGGQDPGSEELCWSAPPENNMRDTSTIFLWALGIMYFVQALGTIICSITMKHFASKYSKDWQKLTPWEVRSGILAKIFPRINRAINWVTCALLTYSFFAVHVVGICKKVENKYGDVVFYPQAVMLTTVILIVFLITCVGGTVFRIVFPYETPFYQPRMRPPEEQKFSYFVWEPICFTCSLLGP